MFPTKTSQKRERSQIGKKQWEPPTKVRRRPAKVRTRHGREHQMDWCSGRNNRAEVKVKHWVRRINKSFDPHNDYLEESEFLAMRNKSTCCIQLRVQDIYINNAYVAPSLISCDFAYMLRLLRQDDNKYRCSCCSYLDHADSIMYRYIHAHRCWVEHDYVENSAILEPPTITIDWHAYWSITDNYRFFAGAAYFPGFFNALAHTRAHRRRDAFRKQLDSLWCDYDEAYWRDLLVKRAIATHVYMYHYDGSSNSVEPLSAAHNAKKRPGGQRGRRRRYRRLLQVKYCAVDIFNLTALFATCEL